MVKPYGRVDTRNPDVEGGQMSDPERTQSAAPFPESQRENLLQSLLDEVSRVADEDNISPPKAFARLALKWLGEDEEGVERITDGAGDRGVDAYRMSPESVVLYQFKGRDTLDRDELLRPGSVDTITDVGRVISLITGNASVDSANSSTRKLINTLQSRFHLYSEAESVVQETDAHLATASQLVTLKLALLADGLTNQAKEEIDRLRQQNEILNIQGVDVLFEIEVIGINDFLSKRWKETNNQWRDATGRKNESIKLRIEGQRIKDKSSMIFYTYAGDLINAFNAFGYQLFEPNVRCQITTSRVNREIGKQVETEKGIDQFRVLNNGVTLVYSSFSERDGSVTLSKPGIVNGLQTVTTLTEKYSTMPSNLKAYFDKFCLILVRLYSKSQVNVPMLVKATNNQNPMEPRNLRSNDPEQILLEQRFSELGWFYERKDYAWEAFISDEVSWPTLKNVNRRSFQVQTGQGGRPAVRRVDNQDLAQAWVAFTGYANEAVQRKRDLFIEDRFYDHAFKARPLKHGSECNFNFSDGRREGNYSQEAPLAESLLLAWLSNYIANDLTPSGRKHREECIVRLNLSGRKREEQDSRLNEDPQYLAGLIRTSASMLFAEMVGLILFRALGNEFYNKSRSALKTTDLSRVFTNIDVDHIRRVVTADTPIPDSSDLFSVLWLTYKYLTDAIAEDISWRNSFFQQSSRPRFLYSADMRRRLKDYVENFDARLSRLSMPFSWTGVLERSGGLFAYARKAIA
jgi:hypothetical protein